MISRAFIMVILGLNMGMTQRSIDERWEAKLEQYVSISGSINYADWKKEAHGVQAYLSALENHPPQPYWTPTDRKAYWINVYNAATISLVLQYYPLSSMQEIDARWETPVFCWSGRSLSLKTIEELLLEMQDPRILFALHRASVSSPSLSRKAYHGPTLEEQLEAATIKFLTYPSLNLFEEGTLLLSMIFHWYKDDFGTAEERLALLKKYICKDIDQKTEINYLPFDWRLNE